jgi:putative endonuclease
MQSQKYVVYILECSDKTLYVGITNDMEKRLHEHNELKSGAKYTRGRRPVVLKYIEKCETKSVALKREFEVRHWSRKKKLQLIVRTKRTVS